MSAAKVSPAGAKPATTTVPCHTRHPVPPRRSAGRRRARLLHHGQRMLGLRAGHDLRLRDAGLPAALSVLDPFLRQVQPAIDRDLPLGAARGSEHPGLTILQLAQSAAPLARHAGRVLTLLHPSSRSRTHRSAGNCRDGRRANDPLQTPPAASPLGDPKANGSGNAAAADSRCPAWTRPRRYCSAWPSTLRVQERKCGAKRPTIATNRSASWSNGSGGERASDGRFLPYERGLRHLPVSLIIKNIPLTYRILPTNTRN